MPRVGNVDTTNLDFARVAIIGSPGSGKSTLGAKLGKALGRQVVHLDTIMWKANWQLPSDEDRQHIHQQTISPDNWIIEGSWFGLIADRVDRATLVVWLDYSTMVCVKSVLARSLSNRGKQANYMAEGCLEKFDMSFVRYTARYRATKRRDLANILALSSDKVLQFTSRRQCQKWLDNLETNQ